MFCSRSITIHLLRGISAILLLVIGIYLSSSYFIVAIGCIAGAFILFRGCPMCWTIGLLETIANKAAKKSEEENRVTTN